MTKQLAALNTTAPQVGAKIAMDASGKSMTIAPEPNAVAKNFCDEN